MRRALLSLLVLAACAEERARPAPSPCPSFRPDVERELARRCVSCHAGAGLDLSTYEGTLAAATAGDPGSPLLVVLDPATADEVHRPHADLIPLLTDWIVTCELSYFDSRIHAPGLLDPASPDFHGTALAGLGYDFAACATCHGEDLRGGAAGATCHGCHEEGPTGCTTCHPGPTSGAHAAHRVPGALGKEVACAECHVVPDRWDAAGHIDAAPAEVVLGALAAHTPPGYERAGPPAYDAATGRCDNVYCHGGAFSDESAGHPAPIWSAVGQGQAACGACHGQPPASHLDDRCAGCHGRVVAVGGGIADTALHLDGALQVGRGAGDCGDCHGDGPDGAPPPDLSGGRDLALVTVGAHGAHVGAHRLRGPIPCADCHLQPAAVDDPGHTDSGFPAEVFPGAGFAGLAAAGGATPGWDRATATCSDVYCHGGGTTRLADDLAPGLVREPGWTAVGLTQAACGRCHGVPPIDGFHAADLTARDCHGCHESSVDELGDIIVTGGTSTHMDGHAP